MKQICDVNGVLFEVVFDTSGPPPVEIRSVHILDNDYRPIGPNLIMLFHHSLLIVAEGEAEPFLSLIAGELPCPVI